jgi:hypothetical protein
VADARVIGDGAGTAHARNAALLPPELIEAIRLRADATQEGAAVLAQIDLLRM